MNRRLYFVMGFALLAGAALGTFGSRAFGGVPTAIGAPSGRINGCFGLDHGFVRIVRETSECGSGEGRVSWNVEGPAGPPGPQGERGPAGPTGETAQAASRSAPVSAGNWPQPARTISWDRR
jgi:hypothetical protein